jgi:hypothetical protein
MSVTGQYRCSAQSCSVKRLSAGDIELLAAVPAACCEDMHVTLAPRTGAHAALQQVVLFTPAEDPNASAHVHQSCPPTPWKGKLITLIVGLLIATFYPA